MSERLWQNVGDSTSSPQRASSASRARNVSMSLALNADRSRAATASTRRSVHAVDCGWRPMMAAPGWRRALPGRTETCTRLGDPGSDLGHRSDRALRAPGLAAGSPVEQHSTPPSPTSWEGSPMNDPIALLKQDHREVAAMLKTLDASRPGARRRTTVAKLTAALRVHMEFEEAELYPSSPRRSVTRKRKRRRSSTSLHAPALRS